MKNKLQMSDISLWSYEDFLKNIRVTRYKDGTNTVCVYPPRPPTNDKKQQTINDSERQEKNARMNRYRRTKAVHYCCRQIVADRMLTLTFRQNITDLAEAAKLFKTFCEIAKRQGLINNYIGVFEQQKRGAWHMHIALGEYVSVTKTRAIWQKILKKRNYDGQVNVASFRGGYKKRTKSISGYLCKYLTKDSDINYIRSRDMPKPEVKTYAVYMNLHLLTDLIKQYPNVEVLELDHGVYYFYLEADELTVFTERIIPNYH